MPAKHEGPAMNTKTLLAALAASALTCPAAAQAEDVQLSASLTGATDYVWRGVSQSNSDPAVFAAVNVNAGGFYAGAGTENVDFAGVKQEWDLWAGYAFDLGKNAKLDLGVVRYGYVDAPADIDTLEVKAGLSGTVGKLGLGVSAYHTWDYFGSGEHATYVEASASAPLTDKLSASAAFGHQQIDNLPDYNTWNAGLTYEVLKGAKVDVRYHDTDTNAFGKLGEARLVGSFTVGF
jgi:uncharacterized protein (TIGR02001 family)